MLSGRVVSLQIPIVVSHHDCVPATLISGLHLFQVLMESLPLLVTHWTQVLRKSVRSGPYVKIGSASWRSCCSPGFWKQSACCWQVLHSFWPYSCQESSSLPEQMPSTLPVPLRSWVFELWISDELPDLRTVKDASFQLLHGQSWKSLAQVSEAVTILVQDLDELLD